MSKHKAKKADRRNYMKSLIVIKKKLISTLIVEKYNVKKCELY